MHDLIIDCYTDEPSWLWVPPFLWTYQRYLSQSLNYVWKNHYYITIDDLRYYKNWNKKDINDYKKTINLTKNCDIVWDLIWKADNIYIISGCFINYNYFSCKPPLDSELSNLISSIHKKITLFYELWIKNKIDKSFYEWSLYFNIDKLVLWNPYNYILNWIEDNYEWDYSMLGKISNHECSILKQLSRPYIIELETWTWCNHGKCSFCIEAIRKTKINYRNVEDILEEVKSLYNSWAVNFRIWKQPNFYNFQNQNVIKFKQLLSGIREICPKLETLHIDNVNAEDVITPNWIEITKLLAKYCTSWNIINFWVETFDPLVREKNRLNWSVEDIHKAIEIINKYWWKICSDWQYLMLPWINILYWLPFHTFKTLDDNIINLEKILKKGLKTRRTFIRRITNPFWFNYWLTWKYSSDNNTFLEFEKTINDNFIMPTQMDVYKIWTIIKSLEEIVYDWKNTIIRKIWTCPERFVVRWVNLQVWNKYNIKITKHIWPRLMEWVVIN